MKRSLFFLTVLLVGIQLSSAQTQLPNNDFETWSNAYTAPPWKAINLGLLQTASKNTDSYQGTYAVKIESKNFFGTILPGYFSTGEMDLENFMPNGGTPFTDRPTGMSFYHKYIPAGQDTMLMFAILTKWNATESKTDTIAASGYFSGNVVSEYARMAMPFLYLSEEVPDSINIGFASSLLNPKQGSALFLDSLTMLYGEVHSPTICLPPLAVSAYSFSANWVPLPAAESYKLDVAEDLEFSAFLAGYETIDVGNVFTYDVNVAVPSLYFYRVNSQFSEEPGGWSNTIDVPMPTEIFSAENITNNGFTVSWQACERATGYFLDLSEGVLFQEFVSGYQNYDNGTSTQIQFADLQPGTNYFLRIRTVYGDYRSRFSDIMQISTENSGVQHKSEPVYWISGRNLNLNSGAEVDVYSIHGQAIAKKSSSYTFSKPGIYILQISTSNERLTKTVYIE